MLEELSKIRNFGDIRCIEYIWKSISTSIDIKNLKTHCECNTDNLSVPVDNIVKLFTYLELINKDEQLIKKVNINYIGMTLLDIISKTLLEKVIAEGFIDIIGVENIKFDVIDELLILKNASIPTRYSGLRNLMIELNIFYTHPQISSLLVVNEKYISYFTSKIKATHKKITLEELKKKLELNDANGEKAEEYVIKYEKIRLKENKYINKVRRISSIDVCAGYDIISLNNKDSYFIDRFIEVKSIAKDCGFYWSENEVRIAREKGNTYYLYLVELAKINNVNYKPIIIQNPYENVFSDSEWIKDVSQWYVSKCRLHK